MIDPQALKAAKDKLLTKGLNASPGAGAGQIVFTAQEAEKQAKLGKGKKLILVRKDTSPEDIGGMVVSKGILTATGGLTSHAAVVACGIGTPCICGASGMTISGDTVKIGAKTFKEGDWITIDGSTGNVYEGELPLVPARISKEMETFLGWCDEVRAGSVRHTPYGDLKGFRVRTNADLPADAKRAFEFGADGVGLCRTEHMFFDKAKLTHFQSMIIAETLEERKAALAEILPLQRSDFIGIFKAMNGKPVTIRLLDPPLHEFLPHTPAETLELASVLKMEPDALQAKIDKLRETNPMLGHRGCRLAVTFPEIYDMQVRAISEAAATCLKEGIDVHPEIMIPIVISHREVHLLRPSAERIMKEIMEKEGVTWNIRIGTMIEVPRAALTAEKIAGETDFFSFGTNDLTQMTYAFSRDDMASFVPTYLQKKLMDVDPFKSIDEDGVGPLMKMAMQSARAKKGVNFRLGICGEHGGDPKTIEFCYKIGLNYVSCSPFRVPLARLAGAQAVIKNPNM
jgi:pyruvate,orthophosphate dikinase